MLSTRHREALAHTELVHAWTTAAAINYSFHSPEQPVTALDFMPNHQDSVLSEPVVEVDEDALEAMASRQQQVLQLAAEMTSQSGPLYDRICLGKT